MAEVKKSFSIKGMLYQCRVCKLHYKEKQVRDKCYDWCSKHPSCNLAIAQQSVEAKRGI